MSDAETGLLYTLKTKQPLGLDYTERLAADLFTRAFGERIAQCGADDMQLAAWKSLTAAQLFMDAVAELRRSNWESAPDPQP